MTDGERPMRKNNTVLLDAEEQLVLSSVKNSQAPDRL
jgi:hypothetical protein